MTDYKYDQVETYSEIVFTVHEHCWQRWLWEENKVSVKNSEKRVTAGTNTRQQKINYSCAYIKKKMNVEFCACAILNIHILDCLYISCFT